MKSLSQTMAERVPVEDLYDGAVQLIRNVPDSPPLSHEYFAHYYPNLPPRVHQAIDILTRRTLGVFHQSTCFFAICKGLEYRLEGLAKEVIARNSCRIQYDEEEHDDIGVLPPTFVGEALCIPLVHDRTESDLEEEVPGNEVSMWVVKWSDTANKGEGNFILISTSVVYGNCTECFQPAPIGMKCGVNCTARRQGRSEELFFVNSKTAVNCKSTAEGPPSWFTERYNACHPFELGVKLLLGGTTPYFDILFYNDSYASRPKYDEKAMDLWRPVPMQKLLDQYLKAIYPVTLNRYPERMEKRIKRATNAHYVDIFDCVDANKSKFQPELFDQMIRERNLHGYSAPRELYYHRTQEEIDEEAEELME